MRIAKTNFLKILPVWLIRILVNFEWFKARYIGPEPEPPEGATELVVYRSRKHPTWGMLAFRMPDGKLYPSRSTKSWEPTEDWELETKKKIEPKT